MKQIPLSKGCAALVDDVDFDMLMQWKWCYNTGYAVRTDYSSGKPKRIYMHRLIMETPSGMETDHINSNRLDNRRSNLRVCTHQQNCMNVLPVGASKYKGVTWHKGDRKWQSSIFVDGKLKYLGSFKSEEDAALAYNFAALEAFGEFAKQNRAAA